MNLPPLEVRQRLLARHRDLGQSADHLDPLLDLLAENGLEWGDWPELFTAMGMGTTSFRSNAFRRVRGLHAAMGRASTLAQRRKARDALVKHLAEEGLSWEDDLPGIIAIEFRDSVPPGSAPASTVDEDVNVLDVVAEVIARHVVLTKAQYTVAALWTLNTFVYDRHAHAPQLGVVAPASSCGKSTLRKVLGALAHSAWHSHNASPATIYRVINRNPRTAIMLDEAENLDWSADSKMRAIVDAAYECDGAIDRVDREGDPYKFQVFAPVLWALRGSASDVPLAVLSRGFIVAMKKGTPRIRLPRRPVQDPVFVGVRDLAEAWAHKELELDPELPSELCRDPRLADKCRPLISVADSLDRGAEARAALIEVCAALPSTDVGVQALEDCRKIFATQAEHLFTFGSFDRISRKMLVTGLLEVNSFWVAWRGPRDKGQPHELTNGELSALLLAFGIATKTIWPLRRRPGDKCGRGWLLSQFARPWSEHLPEGATPTQSNKIIRLPQR
jgi:hypothetical protein